MIKEKVLLIFIDFVNFKKNTAKHSIHNKKIHNKNIDGNVDELKNLAESAGADVKEKI